MTLGQIGVYGLLHRKQKRRTVLHEFGHVIGISHEHKHPDFPYTLDLEAIKSDASNPGIHNYLPTNSEKSYLSRYNIKSIMHYQLAKKETIEGKKFKLNFKLSSGDHIAEFIAMPPCGLSSDDAYKIYLELAEQTTKTGEIVTPKIFCEHLFSNLGVNSTGRCEFPEDRYLVLSSYTIAGLSALGSVLVLWFAKRTCCSECSSNKSEKTLEPPQDPEHDIV
ncbi:MAG: M12 family metallopeptidase [Oligoflexales bacterium]